MMMKRKNQSVRIGLIQTKASSDLQRNLETTVQKIIKATQQGAKIICLQELFLSPYFCQTENIKHFSLAEKIPGETTEKLSQLAKQQQCVIIVPLFEKRARGVYHNTAVVIDADGKRLGHYRKMHIPDDPYFYEKFYFTPGDLGFKVFKTRYAKIGVLICWDQWFPEAARLTALSGAEILFYPTAIGWQSRDGKEAPEQHNAWETIQRGHAVANGIFVASVNRVGKENNLTFWGGSFVANPFGKILAKAGGKEATLLVDCDLAEIEKTRQNWPFLRDRRIDAYHPITSRLIETHV